MTELWKNVLGYEGKYMVSNLGRVKSIIWRGVVKDTIFTPWTNNCGYKMVSLWKNGKKTGKMVSILVWEAFNGPVPKGMQVNHINEDKTDNRLCNLNLLSPKDNCNWGTRNDRISRGGRCKPVTQYSIDGNELKSFRSAAEAERQLGVKNSHCYISACCLGKRNEAFGYKWSFTY